MAPGQNERILDAIHNRRGRCVTISARDPVRTAVGSPGGGIPGLTEGRPKCRRKRTSERRD